METEKRIRYLAQIPGHTEFTIAYPFSGTNKCKNHKPLRHILSHCIQYRVLCSRKQEQIYVENARRKPDREEDNRVFPDLFYQLLIRKNIVPKQQKIQELYKALTANR